MISMVNVTKSYRLGVQRLDALHDVSLEVRRGDFIVIVGRSGAGKSTLLGVLGGLLRPSVGQVLVDGVPIWDIPEAARAQLRSRRIGFAFQNASVIEPLTVIENVLLARVLAGKADAEMHTRATELVASLGLRSKVHAFPEQLSGGERRRVAIASALINDPAVLIADEPTGDLDAETERRLMEHFIRQNQMGTTIVIVTHNRSLAHYANRRFHMNAGQLVEDPSEAAISGLFAVQLTEAEGQWP